MNLIGPTAVSAQSWFSDNTNVATVNGSGGVSYAAAGSTNIGATIPTRYYDWGTGCICHGSFATTYTTALTSNQYNEQAPVQVCVPQSLYIQYEDALTYSGTHAVACGTDAGPPNVWGHSLCVHYQMVDSCGRYITTSNYLINEGLTITQQSAQPGNQSFTPAMNVPVVNGTFGDFLEYAVTTPPGVPSTWYADVYQLIMATDTNTGHVYNLKKSCIYYQSSGITLKDITAGGSCP
jgi:hypothetical protein